MWCVIIRSYLIVFNILVQIGAENDGENVHKYMKNTRISNNL